MQNMGIKREMNPLNCVGGSGIHHPRVMNSGMGNRVNNVHGNVSVNGNGSNITGNGVADIGLRKGPWMPEEDEVLIQYVNEYGPRDWSSIRSKGLLPRTGKSCRLRWVNKLKPDLKSGCKFSPEEEKLVVEMQAKLGNKWAKIASFLPGRTDNDVKNFWSTRQKRIMRAMQRPKTQSCADSNDPAAHTAVNLMPDFSCQVEAPTPLQVINPFTGTSATACSYQHFTEQMLMDMEAAAAAAAHQRQAYPQDLTDIMMVRLQDMVTSDSLLMENSSHLSHQHQQHAANSPDVLDLQGLVGVEETSQSSAMSSNTQKPKNSSRKRSRDPSSHLLDLSTVTAKRQERNFKHHPAAAAGGSSFSAHMCYNNKDFAEATQTYNNNDLSVDVYFDPNDSNILEFFLQQPEVDSLASKTSNVEGANMAPFEYSNGNNFTLAKNEENDFLICNVKEEQQESCTPDSILAAFPPDMFDSLEPLSVSPPPDWWDSRV